MVTSPPFLLLIAATLFSTGGAVIKAVALTGWQRASFRSAIAALFLVIVLPQSRRLPSARTLFVGLCYAATMVTFVLANTYATSATAIFVQDLAPLFVLLLAPRLLGERIHRRDVIFMVVLGALFSLLISAPERASLTASDPTLGLCYAIASCVGWAVTLLGLRLLSRGRNSKEPDAAAQALVVGNVFAFLGALPLALPVATIAARDLLLLGYLGVFQIGVAYLCLARGLRAVPAIAASFLLMLEPVLNPFWTWLVHDEVPATLTLIAGAGILVATAVHAAKSSSDDLGAKTPP